MFFHLGAGKVFDILFKCNVALIIFLALRVVYYLFFYGDLYPHMDEWRFVPVHLGILEHLFGFNYENLQFFTNLQFLLIEYSGLPFRANVFFSYIVYLALVIELYRYLQGFVSLNQRWGLVLSFFPLFSDYMLDNLFWPVLSQTWFYFLFMILAVKYGFRYPESSRDRLLAAVMIGLSVFAMNISFVLMFTCVYVLKNIYNARNKEEYRQECLFAGIWLEGVAILLIIFLVLMREYDGTVIDWQALINGDFFVRGAYFLMSPIFGLLLSPEQSFLCVAGSCALCLGLFCLFAEQMKNVSLQGLWALALILLGSVVAITIFRGDAVLDVAGHTGRYLPFVLLFIPVFYCLGCVTGHILWRRLIFGLMGLIWLTTLIGLYDGRQIRSIERIQIGRDCIETYYKMSPRPLMHYCPNKSHNNLPPYLERFEKVFIR